MIDTHNYLRLFIIYNILTLLLEYTFFPRAVCCPITDHVILSRELFFCPTKNYLFIYTHLFENLKGRISRVSPHGLKWSNKPPSGKRSTCILKYMGGQRGVVRAGTEAPHAHLCISHCLCQHFLVYSAIVWNF